MEGDRMRNRKITKTLKQKSYVIAAVIMLAAAFGMTGIYYSQQNKKQEAQLAKEQEEAEEQAKIELKRTTAPKPGARKRDTRTKKQRKQGNN